jgi:hypothetical protein
MRLKDLQDLQKSQIDAICQDFVKCGDAFYHRRTNKLSFIQNGICIKSDCCFRDKGLVSRKILLPLNIREHFKTFVHGECALPFDKIGQVVVCLSHFFVEHQKHYLENGVLPLNARLMTQQDMSHAEGDVIRDPPEYPIREPGPKAWKGIKIHVGALYNDDWVNFYTSDNAILKLISCFFVRGSENSLLTNRNRNKALYAVI